LLWYLFRRIEKNLPGQPAALIIDEASNALDNPFFKARLKTWLREMRKCNCAVILATQGLGDATDSGIFGILNENTASKIYLPNPAANHPDAYGLYERLGLNPQQISLIATATPKRDYYLVNEDGCRLFDLCLGPFSLAFCTVSDKDSVAQVRRLIAEHGAGWIEPWLASRGLSVPAGGAAGAQQPNLTAFASL
jgi:type IV secretion system protein VirB4